MKAKIAKIIQLICRIRMPLFLQFQFLFLGMFQWAYARFSDTAMSSLVWGEAALVFPLEFWAIAMIVGSGVTIWGLIYPPNIKWIYIGCLVQIFHMGFLGGSAAFTGGDPVIFAFVIILLVPIHIIIMMRSSYEY